VIIDATKLWARQHQWLMKSKASRACEVKLVGTDTEKRTLTNRIFSADRTTLQSWCRTGILFFLAIYISQIPFPKGNASVKSLALGFVAVLWITRLILERRFTFICTRLWWPLLIFTLITLISVIFSIDVEYSLKNIKKYTFTSLFLFFAIVNNVRDLKDVKILLLAFLVTMGFFSVLGLINYLAFEPSLGTRLQFPYLRTNVNRFSKFYDIVIPINFALILITNNKIRKAFYCLILLLSISTVLFMQTRGSYIAIFFALLAIAFVYRKKLLIFLLIIPFLAVIMMPSNMITRAREIFKFNHLLGSESVLNKRPDAWRGALRLITERPLLGLGVGKSNFGNTVKKYKDLSVPYDHAHNTYLQIAVELGLLGLAAFLWLFGSVFYNGFKYYFYLQRKNEKAILIFGILCGISALFIHGLITHFYKHEAFYTLWVIVALLFALIEGDVEKSHSSCAPAFSAR
jgi:O-antigen ligase